ncbi:hypothetical protein NDU88_007721 [Pleurodeles waltl]|uniref:Integrase catalytic domain-containing protein n=1 Tax=Pleurodeles waltl TaxID=8319 RepID=A0AAV7PUR3_PLEWA|nr:hypothetical protein NDU88_007721 [Pleurodeles waltl]
MSEVTTVATISVLREIFTEEWFPVVLITDNGTQLTSYEMKVFLDSCGVKHMRTALYNPRANGIVEQANRMIKGGLQLAVVNGLDVELVISDMVWAHRSTENLVSVRVPLEIMRGRKPVGKLKTSWMEQLVRGCSEYEGEHVSETVCNEAKIKPGDWVKIKSGRIKKRVCKFLGPFKVRNVHGWHVLLENGQRWSFRQVTKFASDWSGENELSSDDCSGYMLMRDEDVVGPCRYQEGECV